MATGLRQSTVICTLGTLIVAAALPSCGRRMNVGAVRGALAADSREPFDLVVALQQLDGGKETDWGRAEQLCRGLVGRAAIARAGGDATAHPAAWPRSRDPGAAAALASRT